MSEKKPLDLDNIVMPYHGTQEVDSRMEFSTLALVCKNDETQPQE